ncbi:MAG: hypothetical protein QNJ44_19865 [Rhodobacter sp.]|nr:hypothetical protein [Rhodobacter sp.]
MANDWILDVLADLKTYAQKNGLSALAEQLEDTMLIAATEIASTEGKAPSAALSDAGTTGHVY